LREKLIKIGAKVVNYGRYVVFQMAEVAVPPQMFNEILMLIAHARRHPLQREAPQDQMRRAKKAEARPNEDESAGSRPARHATHSLGCA